MARYPSLRGLESLHSLIGSILELSCRKNGQIVLILDVLEIGTDQKTFRAISHNNPDYYPIKMVDRTFLKKSELHEMQMVTHSVREKTFKL